MYVRLVIAADVPDVVNGINKLYQFVYGRNSTLLERCRIIWRLRYNDNMAAFNKAKLKGYKGPLRFMVHTIGISRTIEAYAFTVDTKLHSAYKLLQATVTTLNDRRNNIDKVQALLIKLAVRVDALRWEVRNLEHAIKTNP